jgi:hypothetical protein
MATRFPQQGFPRAAYPAELVINQLVVGFYHASVPNSTKLDATLAFTICPRMHGCAFNEYGLWVVAIL